MEKYYVKKTYRFLKNYLDKGNLNSNRIQSKG